MSIGTVGAQGTQVEQRYPGASKVKRYAGTDGACRLHIKGTQGTKGNSTDGAQGIQGDKRMPRVLMVNKEHKVHSGLPSIQGIKGTQGTVIHRTTGLQVPMVLKGLKVLLDFKEQWEPKVRMEQMVPSTL